MLLFTDVLVNSNRKFKLSTLIKAHKDRRFEENKKCKKNEKKLLTVYGMSVRITLASDREAKNRLKNILDKNLKTGF